MHGVLIFLKLLQPVFAKSESLCLKRQQWFVQFNDFRFCNQASSSQSYLETLQGSAATEGDEVRGNLDLQALADKGV